MLTYHELLLLGADLARQLEAGSYVQGLPGGQQLHEVAVLRDVTGLPAYLLSAPLHAVHKDTARHPVNSISNTYTSSKHREN